MRGWTVFSLMFWTAFACLNGFALYTGHGFDRFTPWFFGYDCLFIGLNVGEAVYRRRD